MNFKNRITGTGTADPKTLKANALNWRRHPDAQRKAMQDVLGNIGWIQDVIINKTTGNLIDGHLRVETAIKNKETEIPVKYVELTEDEEKVALATFDPISMMAEQDDELLKQLLAGVDTEMDLSQFHDDYDKLMRKEHTAEELDAVPAVPKEAKTKRGDVYRLGEHVLMCGDSTNADDVKRLISIGGGSTSRAKFLFTSPPYSDMRDYKGGDMSVSNIAKFIPTYRQHVDYQVVNLGLQRKDNEVYQYWDEYIKLAKESGYKLLSWNVWDKKCVGSIGSQRAMFPLVHEWVFVFGTEPFEINNTVEKSDKVNIGLTRPASVRQKDGSMKRCIKHFSSDPLRKMWTVLSILSEHGEIRKDHPATFPVDFPKSYIESMSNPGDIVIEPFCGSGSTLIACEYTGRRCRGMELAPEYCDVIVERWEKLTGKKAELIT